MCPGLVLGFPSRKLTTTSQHLTQTLKDFGLQNQISWNLLLYQPTWQLWQITHVFLWLLSLSCCLEDMVQQPWAKHPDGSKCQPVAQEDTDLMLFTMVSGGDVWCQLGLGIDWPVKPQMKLTAAKWQSTADNTHQNWQKCCQCPKVKAN